MAVKDNSEKSVHILNHMLSQDISVVLAVQPHSFYDLVNR